MTPEQAEALRKPFDDKVIGHLPRITCKACSDARKRGDACGLPNHTKARCSKCNNYITKAHIDLDYVGHAETTDRFLSVDPEWTWEPMAFAPDGLPQVDRSGGLWIRLTIAGVTRPGYGAADGKNGPDAVKEVIGDALRNAGMRFGVALDLWGAKFKEGDGDDSDDPTGETHGQGESWEDAQPVRPQQQPANPIRATGPELVAAGLKAIGAAPDLAVLGELRDKVDGYLKHKMVTEAQAEALRAEINARQVVLLGEAVPAAHVPDGPMMDDVTKRRMFALFGELKMSDRVQQMVVIQQVAGRQMESRNDLRESEAKSIVIELARRAEAKTKANGANGSTPALAGVAG